MNSKMFFGAAMFSTLLVAGEASAQVPVRVGPALTAGFPSGVSAEVVVSPKPIPWLQVGAGVSENFLAPGLIASLTLDPMPWAVGLTLGGDVGGFFPATVPDQNGASPTFSYTYEDVEAGVRFGRRNHFNFFLRGGASHIDLNASNFQNAFTLPNGVEVGDPHASVWTPSAKFGFQWLF